MTRRHFTLRALIRISETGHFEMAQFLLSKERTLPTAMPEGYFVVMDDDEDVFDDADGGAGESENVSHKFQPSGLLELSNSP
jgi:hypothetical protein